MTSLLSLPSIDEENSPVLDFSRIQNAEPKPTKSKSRKTQKVDSALAIPVSKSKKSEKVEPKIECTEAVVCSNYLNHERFQDTLKRFQPRYKKCKTEEDFAELLKEIQQAVCVSSDQRIIRLTIEQSLKAYEWLVSLKYDISGTTEALDQQDEFQMLLAEIECELSRGYFKSKTLRFCAMLFKTSMMQYKMNQLAEIIKQKPVDTSGNASEDLYEQALRERKN